MRLNKLCTWGLLALALAVHPILAEASWPIISKAQEGARYIWVDGLKYDLAGTGDTLLLKNDTSSAEEKEILFTIYSQGKTAFLFREPLNHSHTRGNAYVLKKNANVRARSGLTSFGKGYGNRRMTEPVKAGKNKVWVNKKLYRSVETGDQVNLGGTNMTVRHVISHRGATMLKFNELITTNLNQPQVSLSTSDTDFDNLVQDATSDQNQTTRPPQIASDQDNNNSTPTTADNGNNDNGRSDQDDPNATPVAPPSGPLEALNVARTDQLNDGLTIVAGLDDVSIFKVRLQNPNQSDVVVNTMNFNLETTDAAKQHEGDFHLGLFVGGTQQGPSVKIAEGGRVGLTRLAVNIPTGGSREFELVIDTPDSASDSDGQTDSLQASLIEVKSQVGSNTLPIPMTRSGQNLSQNPLAGARANFIAGGQLTIEPGPTIYSKILVANQVDVEILKIRLSALNDEVQVSDIYLQNDLDNNLNTQTTAEIDGGDRVNFKLYNEAGQLVQSETMIRGQLQFELARFNRIRVPLNGSTTLSVRVDVRDINDVSQTGKLLQLALDTTKQKGVEAVTAAVGAELSDSQINSQNVRGQVFPIRNSNISLRHASTQPMIIDPTSAQQEYYRFTVTADAADEVEIKQLTLRLNLQGMQFSGTPTYQVRQVKSDGTLDVTSNITNTISGSAGSGATQDTVKISFNNQIIAAGGSRTYALLFDKTQNKGNEQDDDAVAISLSTDFLPQGPSAASALSNQNIIWSDESDVAGANDYFNGYLIQQDTTTYVNSD